MDNKKLYKGCLSIFLTGVLLCVFLPFFLAIFSTSAYKLKPFVDFFHRFSLDITGELDRLVALVFIIVFIGRIYYFFVKPIIDITHLSENQKRGGKIVKISIFIISMGLFIRSNRTVIKLFFSDEPFSIRDGKIFTGTTHEENVQQ